MTTNLDTQWEPQRDRWGRPLIVPPGGGKPVGYTRATTVAKTLDDEGSLTAWAQRMTAAGLVRRPDLYALIGTKLGPSGDIPEAAKKAVQELCDQAKEAAAASSAANLGTALHGYTEQYDIGIVPHSIPEQFKADIDAYRRTVEPFEVLAVEQFVVLDDHQVAGTLDRLWRLPDGRVVIADLKTGQNLDYSWRSIAVQLAIYANGQRYRDGLRSPLWVDGKVDTDLGIVIHLPVGRGECTLYEVDLRAGTIALQHSIWARNWRKRRDLATPFAVPGAHTVQAAAPNPSPTTAAASPARQHLEQRIARIRDTDGGLNWLRNNWPADIPTLKQSDRHNPHELQIIARVCDDADKALSLPFADHDIVKVEPDPAGPIARPATVEWMRPKEGRKASQARVTAIRQQLNDLDDDQRNWLRNVMDEARACGRDIVPNGEHTERSVAICTALLGLSKHHDDPDFVRLLLAAALDSDGAEQPTVSVGMSAGTLTLKQATDLATALGTEVPVTFADDGRPRLVLDTAA